MARWKNRQPASTAPSRTRADLAGTKELMEWKVTFLTPMFGGGVFVSEEKTIRHLKKPDPITPVRVAAIRGQLRFWWRAAIGSREASLKNMRDRESSLFGTAGERSSVEIVVSGNPQVVPKKVFAMALNAKSEKQNPKPIKGLESLAYGAFPLQPQANLPQPAEPGVLSEVKGDFSLSVKCRPEHVEEIERTVETWLALGGLGGRTRRGFGALSGGRWPLHEVFNVKEHQTLCGVPSLVRAEEFRAVVDGLETAEGAHKRLLDRLRSFRQHRNGPRGRSHWPEPDEIRRITEQHLKGGGKSHEPVHPVHAFPRGLLGMPIIFHFKDVDKKYPENPAADPKDTSLVPIGCQRLASPLVLRPWKEPNGEKYSAIAVVLHDPARATLKGEINGREVRLHLKNGEADWKDSPLAGEPDPLIAFLNFFRNEDEV